MTSRLLTPCIATITEMREPHKVLERSGGRPVAVLKNSQLVGYFVPAEAVQADALRHAAMEEVADYIARSRARVQPVLDYLKDK